VPSLSLLSRPLHIELQAALLIPQLVTFPFFNQCKDANKTAMRELCCTAVTSHSFANTDTIFIQGSEAKDMYFICGDEAQVVIYHVRFMGEAEEECNDVKLLGGSWVGEGALWMPWWYRGSLTASTEAELLFLNSKQFGTVACAHPDLHCLARSCAFNYWMDFIDGGDNVTDLPRHSMPSCSSGGWAERMHLSEDLI